MNTFFCSIKNILRNRVRPESPEIIAAIDALQKSEKFLLLDDLDNCLITLNSAAKHLGINGEDGTSISGPAILSPLAQRAKLLKKGKTLSKACRNALRESASNEESLIPIKNVVITGITIVVMLSITVIFPYTLTDGKISMARTQVYWSRFPGGVREIWSLYSPITLDGEWHEIRIKALDPMTAVRIDPATDATVLDYYDIRNARVVWREPEAGFEPELEQVHWRGTDCIATNADGYLNVTEMKPDCNVTSMNFPMYYEVSEIVFEARAESRKLGVLKWLYWSLGWRAINE